MIFKNIRSFDKDRRFIAVFDFNGTLIKGNTSFLFLYYLRGIFGLAVDLFNILFKLEDKTSNLFNKKLIIEKLIDNAIKRSSNSQKEYILKKKLPNILKRKLRPEALKRVEWHKKKGHRCLIISSSPKAFLIDISKYLNVELISTYCDDVLSVGKTSQLKLSSSNGSCLEKINLLEKYLGYLPNPEEIEVYGDNFLDKELLEYSRYPHFRSFDNKCVKYSDQKNVTFMVNIFASIILFFGVIKLFTLKQTELITLTYSLKKIIFWIPIIYSILLITYIIRYIRWRIILDALKLGTFSKKDIIWWFRGFVLTATPAKLGEISRVFQLNKNLGYLKKPLFSAFFLERIFDVLSVAVWIILLSPEKIFNKYLLFYFPLMIFIFSLIMVSSRNLFRTFYEKIKDKFLSLLPDISKIKLIKISIFGIFVSFIFWSIEASILWIIVFSISPIKISLSKAIYIYLISGVAGMLTGLPGGIGINETASTLMLVNEGLTGISALTVSILRRIFTIWSITVLSLASSLPVKKRENQFKIFKN